MMAPSPPGVQKNFRKFSPAHLFHQVQISHDQQWLRKTLLSQILDHPENIGKSGSIFKRKVGGFLKRRPIRDGIGKWHAQFQCRGTAFQSRFCAALKDAL